MNRFILPFERVEDNNGHPLDGAMLYFYENGTTTLKNTYSDEARTILNTNPVAADGSVQFKSIFLDNDFYTIELKNKDGETQGGYPLNDVSPTSNIGTIKSEIVPNVATLRNGTPSNGASVYVQSHTLLGDGGGGYFEGVTGKPAGYFTSPTGTEPENNGNIIVPTGGDGSAAWVRNSKAGFIRATEFGILPDIISNQSALVQKAIDYSSSVGGGVVQLEKGFYYFNVTVPRNVTINGVCLNSTSLHAAVDAAVIETVGNEDNANNIGLRNVQIDGSSTLSATTTNQTGLLLKIAPVGVADGVVACSNNYCKFENVVIKNMGHRGVHLEAQPDRGLGLKRYLQHLQFNNVHVFNCTNSGLFIRGHVIESSFVNMTVSNCGTSSNATIADRLNSPVVIDAVGIVAAPVTIGDVIFPARLNFRNLIVGDNGKAASHTNDGIFIRGGRQIKFDTVDMENLSTCVSVESLLSPSTQTVLDVKFDTVSHQGGVVTTHNAFARLESVRRFSLSNVNDGEDSAIAGVDVNTTFYSSVVNVDIDKTCSFKTSAQVKDDRFHRISAGLITINGEGSTFIGGEGGAVDALTTINMQTRDMNLRTGTRINIFNRYNTRITLDAAALLLSPIPFNLVSDMVLDANDDNIVLEYNQVANEFREVSRSALTTDTFNAIANPTSGNVDVANRGMFNLTSATARNLNTLIAGVAGQEIMIYFGDANTTVVHSGLVDGIFLKGRVNQVMAAQDVLRIKNVGAKWYEV